MRVFLDLMWFFKMHKGRYAAGISLLLCVAILSLIPPHAVGVIMDAMRRHTLTRGMILQWVAILAVDTVFIYAMRYIWRVLLFGSAMELAARLREKLYEHFTRMSPQFYHKNRIGDLMAHSTNDVQAVEMTATDGILTLVDSISTGIVVITTMATTLSWKLTLITLIPMPIMAFATSRYGRMMHTRFHIAQEAFAEITEYTQETIAGIRVIKAFGQEDVERKRFAERSLDVVKKNIRVARIDALFDPTISLVVGCSYLLSVGFGALFVVHRQLTIGELTTFTLYLGQLIWPMLAFGWLFNIVERGRASDDRIKTLLSTPEDIRDAEITLDGRPTGEIAFALDEFTYPDAEKPVLKNIHFSIKQGQTLGIVGRTGSGKTTLFKLLLREFDVTQGEIFVGGQPIDAWTLSALRGAIAYVPQDHFLFSASIAQNIAFARASAPLEEIQGVARQAAIHEDILRFPDGYATVVGERGVTLSGGQKQRVSIARALLMDAEILILDDSLSAVDATTEASILHALRQKPKTATTLIATHRLSSVEHADLILVLEDGEIVERGAHMDLLAQNGVYAAMYERQQLENIVEHGGVSA
ncbi:ABC transporter transmembrane domain-containing protein [Ferroacidibacillus organovorans]|uniref:ABC transporter transmembrane domain-containing protein n=1 Tax=Ferroacidibacillus organovorans TaxID=1765683 RepID=UPI0007A8C805|nr:ABC transporter transmembrane domain-containing protein [Ferroacidibacillus organovorans]KYP80754.1 multidrug ABC transporter ATP-binding protein [Ferroacidibacillus organovorans]